MTGCSPSEDLLGLERDMANLSPQDFAGFSGDSIAIQSSSFQIPRLTEASSRARGSTLTETTCSRVEVDSTSQRAQVTTVVRIVRILRFCGQGSHYQVHQMEFMDTPGDYFARKEVHKLGTESETTQLSERLRTEAKYLKKLDPHPLILSLLRENGSGLDYSIDLEVFEESLEAFLDAKSTVVSVHRDTFIRDGMPWFGGLTSGLAFIHDEKIIHNDMKPANCLLRGGRIVIADFGASIDVSNEEKYPSGYVHKREGGSDLFAAPEVIDLTRAGYTYNADTFSLGIVFAEMLSGYCGQDRMDLRNHMIITSGLKHYSRKIDYVKTYLSHLNAHTGLSDETQFDVLIELTGRMISHKPEDRPKKPELEIPYEYRYRGCGVEESPNPIHTSVFEGLEVEGPATTIDTSANPASSLSNDGAHYAGSSSRGTVSPLETPALVSAALPSPVSVAFSQEPTLVDGHASRPQQFAAGAALEGSVQITRSSLPSASYAKSSEINNNVDKHHTEALSRFESDLSDPFLSGRRFSDGGLNAKLVALMARKAQGIEQKQA